MADFTTTAAKRLTITIGDINGDEHPFEVLPFTTSRLKAAAAFSKAILTLQEKALADETSDAELVMELQTEVAKSIDDRVRSLNGPTTVSSLVKDELIEFINVRQIGEYLQKVALGDPPA